MPKASVIQSSFNAGELSPRMYGRVDIENKYNSGCRLLENFIATRHGGAFKRSGTRFVREVKTSADTTVLIPFEFSTEQAYILELGDLYFRVYKDDGIVLSGGSPYEVVTPYSDSEVSAIQYAQSADVLYLAHPNHPPQKISRTGDTSWTISEISFDAPPFKDENTDTSITVYASAATGAGITLTASSSIFTSDMVDGYFKFRELIGTHHPQWITSETLGSTGFSRRNEGSVYENSSTGTTGTLAPIHESGTESDGAVDWDYLHDDIGWVKITGYTSGTVVTADVVSRLPDSVVGAANATFRWAHGSWSDEYGHPKTVAFYEDRLLWASTSDQPQTIWGSKSGLYEDHTAGTNDDDAYEYTIASEQVNVIEWLSPARVLIIGTAGGEFVMTGSTSEDPVTPTNIRIVRQTAHGSKSIRALSVANATIFVQRSARKLRELIYNFDSDAYLASDLTLVSEHITLGGVDGIAYQQEPDSLLWAVRSDGKLLCMTYDKNEEVIGWHRHVIGGNTAKVKSIATIPHPDGDKDRLWMIVSRVVNGSTVQHVEYLEPLWDGTVAVGEEVFVDSALSYSGAAVTSVSGLDHLEGESVTILADGATHPNKTVLSGSITLDRSASKVQAGLGYNADIQLMNTEAGAADGTSQAKTKRITNCAFRLHETGPGLWMGGSLTDLEEIQFRNPSMAMDSPVPLFSGDKGPFSWPNGADKEGRVTARHQLPLPCNILAIIYQVVTQDR